jgi:hypothetical protein
MSDFFHAKRILNETLITEIEIQAEIKMGEYLKDMEKNKGGRPIEKTCTTEGQVSEPATYEEIGITRNEASDPAGPWPLVARRTNPATFLDSSGFLMGDSLG